LRELWFKASPGQIIFEAPISKIRRPKWTGDMPQVEEVLLFKSKVLSSNPIPPPSIKKENYN
jgi:hypothetical protein